MEKDNSKKTVKPFRLSAAAINNRKTVLLITMIIVLMGYGAYQSMPKESFPEINIPEVYVSTPYPGGNSKFIRDKITKPIEEELNSVKNVKKITSTSKDGISAIKVEFDFKVSPDEGLRKVKDAVEDARAQSGFPTLQFEPKIIKADITDIPILNVNLSSEIYGAAKLEEYGKLMQDELEALPEVSEVVIRGVPEKKVIIELNRTKMTSKRVTFQDVENAINSEHVILPSGDILIGGRKVTVKIDGEYKDYRSFDSLIVKADFQEDEVYLAEVTDTIFFGDADATSFARQYTENVVMLDVKKRAGENLLDATDKIEKIVAARNGIPATVDITVTNKQSTQTEDGVSNLENSIIFGVILVVLVLLFFLGLRNALFVGIAIPLSMFMSFLLLNSLGVTLNIMVLFSSVLALGMLVDNGIVVVENIYRLLDEGYTRFEAAKMGVSEVAWPIIASTATTLAAFVPLAFWPGIMGEFFKYLPITLIIILGSSLFVALVINPVFTALYMKIEEDEPNKKRRFITAGIALGLGLLTAVAGIVALSNMLILIAFLILLNMFVLRPGTKQFQTKFLPRLERGYNRFLTYALTGKRPRNILLGTIGLLILSFMMIGAFPPKTLFFPENQPNYLNIFIEHPVGTDIYTTDATTSKVYSIVDSVLNEKKDELGGKSYAELYDKSRAEIDGKDTMVHEYLIKSVISQVGRGTSDPAQGQPELGDSPHKARLTVQFAEFQHRNGIQTSDIMAEIIDALSGRFPAGVRVIVDKNAEGPPQDPPVNIEIKGPGAYAQKIAYADSIRNYLTSAKHMKKYESFKYIPNQGELRLDVETNKLELPIELDKMQLRKLGTSTFAVANIVRTALFGKDIAIYKSEGDSYDINLRLSSEERNDLDALMNQEITFRNMRGNMVSIPVRSVVKRIKPTIYSTYGSVVRKEVEDVVTIYSKVTKDDQANIVVDDMREIMEKFDDTPLGKEMKAKGYTYEFTGGQAQQAEQMSFLSTALGIAVFLILLIIVTQFNSFSTPVIILSAVLLSLIGVLLGLVIFRQDFVIIMTMIGIISLAGVVVNNAIVLIDYTNLIRTRKREEKGLTELEQLDMDDVVSSIVEGGKTRLRPVLLTAITTVLGLIPLATGLNINFVTLFTHYDPQVFVGGDNAIFFGPMSWTIIYGLTFATFLTLVVVPIMYLLLYRLKVNMYKRFGWELRSNI